MNETQLVYEQMKCQIQNLEEENKRAIEGQKVGILARDYFGKDIAGLKID